MNFSWILLFVAISIQMLGQTMLKAAASSSSLIEQIRDWRTVSGLAIYAGSSLLYIISLRRIPLSAAVPFAALTYVGSAAIGHYVFAEPISTTHLIALGVICSGVVLLLWA